MPMLRALNRLLDKAFTSDGGDQTPAERTHGLQIATALLLIEVARADYEQDLTEDEAVFALIKAFFQLGADEARLLVAEAARHADHAASLQSFTRRLNEQLTADEKLGVVEMLWRVALADRRLDKHEDHIVRKVADLLYVPHSALIRVRNRVRESL
jgi:uncharacterized tellurite resistance protein B-like protein